MAKSKPQRVTIAELARALVTMVENGYGDCPLYVSTEHDIAPLSFLLVRRRNTSAFLCGDRDIAIWNGKLIDLKGQANG